MRISFDLDDTLICYDPAFPREPRLPWPIRRFIHDEPLRAGTKRLAAELSERGHELWVYTTSHRHPRRVRWWLRLHGIRVRRVVNGTEHDRCFGAGSTPSKRPHVFKIDLHVDDSKGVAAEGEQHGFCVCVVSPSDERWGERVHLAVNTICT